MAQRKSINFNVSQETYDQVKELFPDVVGTEDNLKQLLSAYRFHIEHKNDSVDINLQLEEVRSDLNDKVAELQRAEAHGQALQQQLNELGNKTNKETASLQEQIRTLEEQNMSLASVTGIYCIEVYGILKTRHPCNKELLAVRTPERDAEILILGLVEICPDNRPGTFCL